MRWEAEAEAALKRVPVFVRKMVRKRVEEYAEGKGCSAVTLAEIEEARSLFKQGRPPRVMGKAMTAAGNSHPDAATKGSTEHDSVSFEDGVITSERVERLESLSERGTIKAKHYVIKVCGAPFGCPRQVVNPGQVMERLAKKIDGIGYGGWLEERVEGPILSHHKIRIALSGCPNACSQPQIQDFGVFGRAIPEQTEEPCIKCMECVEACREDCVEVINAEPIINYAKCVGCSDCARACPTGTLIAQRRGYSILVGGRMGRHPRFAEEIMHLASEDGVIMALEACLEICMANAEGEERFAKVFDRLGADAFKRAVEDKIRGVRV